MTTSCDLQEIKTLAEKYRSILEEEYRAISELLRFLCSDSYAMEVWREKYVERFSQIKKMLDECSAFIAEIENAVAEMEDAEAIIAECTSTKEDPSFATGEMNSVSSDLNEVADEISGAEDTGKEQTEKTEESDTVKTEKKPMSLLERIEAKRKRELDEAKKEHQGSGRSSSISNSPEFSSWSNSYSSWSDGGWYNSYDSWSDSNWSNSYSDHTENITEVEFQKAGGLGESPDSLPSGNEVKPVDYTGFEGLANDIQNVIDANTGIFGKCRVCGTEFNQVTYYCPVCGTKVQNDKPAVTLDMVQFSAVVPKTFVKGDYSLIEIFMYEKDFRRVVDEALENADDPVKETRSGVLAAERKAKIKVVLSSPDIEIEDDTEIQTWEGDYLDFSFAVELPEHYSKKQILFIASVYFNDMIATKLKFIAKCRSFAEQKIEMVREDVLSAFVSYASQDRKRVASIIQGMKKARPDMDIFFDVESLRSGEDWEKALKQEIDKRDVLFLCWSKYARKSKWVDAEWRYAFKRKGVDSIEPVPIDPPASCPPPEELSRKHFNDKLLYIINSNINEVSEENSTSSNEASSGIEY